MNIADAWVAAGEMVGALVASTATIVKNDVTGTPTLPEDEQRFRESFGEVMRLVQKGLSK
jgi:hypothetical protein